MTDVAESAREHLWMHFTRLSSYDDAPVPVIVKESLSPRAAMTSCPSTWDGSLA